jgi:hypothetical protein
VNSHDQAARRQPPMSTTPVAIAQPKHPLHALATFELCDYRRQLEQAIASLDHQDPAPSARAGLQARLDAVLTEQDERARLARA